MTSKSVIIQFRLVGPSSRAKLLMAIFITICVDSGLILFYHLMNHIIQFTFQCNRSLHLTYMACRWSMKAETKLYMLMFPFGCDVQFAEDTEGDKTAGY